MISFDSSEIDNWSDKPDAHHRLPELIRRLVMATVPMPSGIDIPSGSSVRLSGWDGLVDVEGGNAWVPSGLSAWELSCENSRSLRNKATADYRKRTANPQGVDIPSTAFVFATTRRWAGKREWARERREEGLWADVRAIDADDLVAWLEQTPDVSVWFARLIGKIPSATEDILANGNLQESLHIETRGEIAGHMDAKFAGLEAALPFLLAGAVAKSGLAEQGTFLDPSHRELAEKIDFARGLIHRGLISSARLDLERLKKEAGAAPDELKFRIITNLGACALADEDIDVARDLLEEACRLQPENQIGIGNAALAAQLGKDSKRAMELAHRARASDPQDSQATSVLLEELWEAAEVERLEELVAAEDWITRDRQCALVLSDIWVRQSRFEEAVTLCRFLIETDPEDAVASFALSGCLLNYAQSDRLAVGYTDGSLARFREAEASATRAIELLQPTELKARRRDALVNRAAARLFIGASAEALQDLNQVLGETPTQPDALLNKGLLLLYEGRPEEARAAYGAIQDTGRRADAVLPLAGACLASGDGAAAAELLKGAFTLEQPEWEDVHKAEVLSRAEAAVGDEDSVGPALAMALERDPDNPRLLALAAVRHNPVNDPDDAEESLLEALERAGKDDRQGVLVRLGYLYHDLGRFAEAADRLAEVVGGFVSHPSAISLLVCLVNGKRLREALGWSRRIREAHGQPPRMAIEVEAKILDRIGDIRATISCLEVLCSRSDATPG